MTREDIDVLWQRALRESVEEGEMFTRYRFAALIEQAVRADENEQCARVCEELDEASYPHRVVFPAGCAAAIRERRNHD